MKTVIQILKKWVSVAVPDAMLPNAMWPSAVDASPILFNVRYGIEQILNFAHNWNMVAFFFFDCRANFEQEDLRTARD